MIWNSDEYNQPIVKENVTSFILAKKTLELIYIGAKQIINM
jgi:hypothetical protein